MPLEMPLEMGWTVREYRRRRRRELDRMAARAAVLLLRVPAELTTAQIMQRLGMVRDGIALGKAIGEHPDIVCVYQSGTHPRRWAHRNWAVITQAAKRRA